MCVHVCVHACACVYAYKYVHVYFGVWEGTAEQPMEGRDQMLREERHREGNGIHLIGQQKGELIRKRKENNWAWERGRAEDNGERDERQQSLMMPMEEAAMLKLTAFYASPKIIKKKGILKTKLMVIFYMFLPRDFFT